MPDDSATPPATSTSAAGTGGVTVAEDVRLQFPDLIDLILTSESMNDEERQYWINILPIMTPEQVQNLRDILTNERTQLAAIDAKYSKQIDQTGQEQFIKQVEEERKKRHAERTTAEEQAKQDEGKSAEDVLKEIDLA